MRVGATLGRLTPGPPIDLAETAKRLVDSGFESLWVPQIIGRGYLVADPFVSLAVAATATEGVELGTATLQVPLHHPAALAHRILSLLSVCGDRLTLGVSPGSTATDYAALGASFGSRFRVLHETLPRLRRLVSDGADEDVDLAPPSVTRAVPFLLGSWGANVERAARDFDGWIASAYRTSVPDIIDAHTRFRAAGGARAMVCAIPVASSAELEPTAAALAAFAKAGFDDAIVLIDSAGPPPEQVRSLYP